MGIIELPVYLSNLFVAQMIKLQPRKIKRIAKGHPADEWLIQAWFDSDFLVLATVSRCLISCLRVLGLACFARFKVEK